VSDVVVPFWDSPSQDYLRGGSEGIIHALSDSLQGEIRFDGKGGGELISEAVLMKMLLTLGLIGGALLVLSAQAVTAQTKRSANVLENNSRRFRIRYEGTLVEQSDTDYSVRFPSLASKTGGGNGAHIFVSQRPFVDLPGSYGGRLYYDSPEMQGQLQNRVYIDTTGTYPTKFRREYWTVYAGMGAWDCVTNCYAEKEGEYYILSIVREMMSGKPGQQVEGRQLTSEELKASLLKKMQDTTDTVVHQFNSLVDSFRFEK
jgi:hypothetical protein